ncbi:E3 ubiquitin-protein ligase PDZRN3-B [Hydra vulgaris]|uniref:E3 ubiquitin-protein ligase PDZRN3-B n=1 Tax=Hydra vulgaris TaxID=6087 RepID=UPI0001924082|nr:E3 ubiquitin-protein ligase PDZRN3-B [Hydra vulgaris]
MGWDIDRFPEGEVHLELVCCICTCVLEEPVESPCRHVFCSKCIRTWLRNQNSCPQCRSTVHKKDLISALPALKNIISKQRIFCEFKDLGCPDIVPIEQLESHTLVCQYGLIACLNLGCNVKVLRKDFKLHSDVCAKRMVLCDLGCEMFYTVGEKATHNCIRSLYSHFQDVTNELMSRISKLEEQVNILTSKSNQSTQTSCLTLPNGVYMSAPFSNVSSQSYEALNTTGNDHHGLNNANLTSYPIESSDLSDVVESIDSDATHEISPPVSPTMSDICDDLVQNSNYFIRYFRNIERTYPIRRPHRRSRQAIHRSRSPQIYSAFQGSLHLNNSRNRINQEDNRRLTDNDRHISTDPIILENVSEISASSTESDTE